MNKTRLQIARADIMRHFDQLPDHVLKRSDIAREVAAHRGFWRLAQQTTTEEFIKFLQDSTKLSKVVFPFPKPYKREIRYVWGEVPIQVVMLSLKPDSYFSHYTAVYLHGLTEQVPKTTYLNHEQRLASWLSGTLSQRSIDAAFRRPVRITKNVAETQAFRVCVISGKNTARLNVVDREIMENGQVAGRIQLTDLERTLIDIAVRPVYSGGLVEVRKAYELAREKVQVNRLAATLKKLAYIYPYHQVIGFYMDRAGYKPGLIDLLRKTPMEFDFYLAHAMGATDYVKEWRLFIPKGF